MYFFRNVIAVSCMAMAMLTGCSENPAFNAVEAEENGNVSFRCVADATSDFSDVVQSAEMVVSGEHMKTITKALTVTGNGISGSLTGIPAGPDRTFEVFCYNKNGGQEYFGWTQSDIDDGYHVQILITLLKTPGEGDIEISGTFNSVNVPPEVTLTSPNMNDRIVIGSPVHIEAAASDPDGTVSSVTFYYTTESGTVYLGKDISAPYVWEETAAAEGTYVLWALAEDNDGTTTKSSEVNVTVISQEIPFYQINAGGSNVTPYKSDNYFSGGTPATTSNTITTTGIENPAPQDVYRSERYGDVTYTIPNLKLGDNYVIRLHFAELYWNESGKRRFNISIDGSMVINNMDIFTSAGGANKAYVKEFNVKAAQEDLRIELTSVTDNAQICGIEVIPQQQMHVVTYDGNGGGDQISMSYNAGKIVTVETGAFFSKAGYLFDGWNTARDGSGTAYQPGYSAAINADVTLYAQWKPEKQTFTVTYNGNGVGSNYLEMYLEGDFVTVLVGDLYSYYGHVFRAWNTQMDGTGVEYIPGQTFQIHNNITLFAQWEPEP